MKKFAIIALAVAGIGINDGKLSAQSSQGFYGGINFMPTVSQFNVQTIDNGTAKAKMVLGYGFGLQAGYNFNEHVATQLEAIYSTLSQKYTDRSLERTIDLSYVHFPLTFRYNTDITGPVNFNIVLGPQVGVNVGSKIRTEDGRATDTVEAILAVKPADFGIAYGAGLNFGLGQASNPKINVGFRGVQGILDISESSQTTTTDQYYILDRSRVRTYAGVIGLTYLF